MNITLIYCTEKIQKEFSISTRKKLFVIDAIKKDRFLVTPHKEVLEYIQRKSSDYDRWILGMQRLQKKFEDFYNKFNSS